MQRGGRRPAARQATGLETSLRREEVAFGALFYFLAASAAPATVAAPAAAAAARTALRRAPAEGGGAAARSGYGSVGPAGPCSRANASTCARCSARRPVPACSIWLRQEKPSPTITASRDASRTFGSSTRSPQAIETS